MLRSIVVGVLGYLLICCGFALYTLYRTDDPGAALGMAVCRPIMLMFMAYALATGVRH